MPFIFGLCWNDSGAAIRMVGNGVRFTGNTRHYNIVDAASAAGLDNGTADIHITVP